MSLSLLDPITIYTAIQNGLAFSAVTPSQRAKTKAWLFSRLYDAKRPTAMALVLVTEEQFLKLYSADQIKQLAVVTRWTAASGVSLYDHLCGVAGWVTKPDEQEGDADAPTQPTS